MQPLYQLAADLLVLTHLTFVGFVLLGALLVLRWRWVAVMHIPALLWGVYTEFCGVICPLTPLEITLRQLGGQSGYEGDFVTHYLVPVLYPADLTRSVQVWLGALALIPNLLIYGYIVLRRGRGA